ncbi:MULTISPECIES: FMN-dependent NADH-azoreductase [Sphingobium]|uniref:FMN-dependent NADH-azoreductase n=1 Tax=Sphingobium TaxID=165695 RepID=UPI0015EBC3EA|nr:MULTISPECIES: NAD(P)H-dependent oxidoreductase [Sphingobium]MCW2364136.1 FMN-dependent NADH-azoreductase [Sphingobium sp. B10D3B]MCW2402467.1 FMN-dependent NADH-azoreductase [Sphingobium sp. B10D7B]MCW2409446.1 FMN-dependent NADH-azoreductase [Sphingobium xanthum]
MTVLHIDSSIQGENSITRQISAAIVERLTAEQPGADVRYRDLAAQPLPHLTLPGFGTDEAAAVLAEFLAADTVVIGAPMYNFTISTQLKAWIDHIAVAGKTFRYDESGNAIGLAGDKRVIVALSRGGFYGAGTPAAAVEHAESYLRAVFGFIGIVPEFIVAEGAAVGPEHRAAGIEAALAAVDQLEVKVAA